MAQEIKLNASSAACPSDVPSNAAPAAREGLSRRSAMTMLSAAAAAAPAVGFLPAFPVSAAVVTALPPDHHAWDFALARLRSVEAEYQRFSPLHSAAFDAAEAECPYRRDFFSRYGLGC